jgi:hypothetical protein
MKDILLVKDPLVPAAYRCIESQFRNVFSSSHIALHSIFNVTKRRLDGLFKSAQRIGDQKFFLMAEPFS